MKECCETVCKKVCETCYKDVCCTTCKAVTECCEKQVCETCYKNVTRRICVPCTTYKTVTRRITECVDEPYDPCRNGTGAWLGNGPFRGLFSGIGRGNGCNDACPPVTACKSDCCVAGCASE